jgi:WD40 repeat protein
VASWSARSGKELFRRRLAYHATTIAYSSDSRLLALGTETGQVRFWNARSGAPQGPPIHPSTSTVSQISFSPDGPLLVVSAQDTNTTLWDVRSRKQVGLSFPSRPGVLTAPVFEPDGRLLIDYLADAAEWPINVSMWERFACKVAGRNLTQAEWRDILPNRSYMRVCPATG